MIDIVNNGITSAEQVLRNSMSGLQIMANSGADILTVSFANPLKLNGIRFTTQFVKKIKVIVFYSGGQTDTEVSH